MIRPGFIIAAGELQIDPVAQPVPSAQVGGDRKAGSGDRDPDYETTPDSWQREVDLGDILTPDCASGTICD
jgi:hypothetical protein